MADTPLIEADGTDGSLRLHNNSIEIINSRFLEFLRAGEAKTTIPRDNIGQISFREAGKIRSGVIKIFPSGVENSDIDINTEVYTVRFTFEDEDVFTDIYERLQEMN
jgi:hypothetical protein